MKNKKLYGLFTIISMIVGIVVGSGIYFRADDIFGYTRGNIWLALLILLLASISIIFGSLSLAEFTKDDNGEGGITNFFEKYISKKLAAGFSYFQFFIYTPTLLIVIAWVGGIYTLIFLGLDYGLFEQILLGIIYIIILLFVNVFNKRVGAIFQNITTVVKLIPLFIIGIYGVFFAKNPTSTQVISTNLNSSFGIYWLAGLVPLAYSYDGWTIALNISTEVKNPKKNVSLALSLSPIIILFIYLLYIFGIYKILGSQEIIALGDKAVFAASVKIFGPKVAKIIILFVIISVLGVLNGILLAFIRLPQALKEKSFLRISLDTKKETNLFALIFLIIIFWAILHYFVMKYNLFAGRDVSEIAIVFSYLIYSILYQKVFTILNKERSIKILIPIFAILGSLTIFIGSILTNALYVSIFISISAMVVFIGYISYKET